MIYSAIGFMELIHILVYVSTVEFSGKITVFCNRTMINTLLHVPFRVWVNCIRVVPGGVYDSIALGEVVLDI